MNTFFILGTNRDLAREEAAAVLQPHEVVLDADDVLVIDGIEDRLEILQERLAGVVKTGRIYEQVATAEELPDLLSGLALAPKILRVRIA